MHSNIIKTLLLQNESWNPPLLITQSSSFSLLWLIWFYKSSTWKYSNIFSSKIKVAIFPCLIHKKTSNRQPMNVPSIKPSELALLIFHSHSSIHIFFLAKWDLEIFPFNSQCNNNHVLATKVVVCSNANSLIWQVFHICIKHLNIFL